MYVGIMVKLVILSKFVPIVFEIAFSPDSVRVTSIAFLHTIVQSQYNNTVSLLVVSYTAQHTATTLA